MFFNRDQLTPWKCYRCYICRRRSTADIKLCVWFYAITWPHKTAVCSRASGPHRWHIYCSKTEQRELFFGKTGKCLHACRIKRTSIHRLSFFFSFFTVDVDKILTAGQSSAIMCNMIYVSRLGIVEDALRCDVNLTQISVLQWHAVTESRPHLDYSVFI